MAVAQQIKMRRLKTCPYCNQFAYHDYIVDFPVKIFVCSSCSKEHKEYSK